MFFRAFGYFFTVQNIEVKKINLIVIIIAFAFLTACKSGPGERVTKVDKQPQIEPGYTGITIPVNIAPLNFILKEKGDSYAVTITSEAGESIEILSREGEIIVPEKKWRSLLNSAAGQKITYKTFVKNAGKWIEFESFSNSVSKAPIPPYVLYRLLYPGYESWKEMSIMQRSLETFDEKAVIKNEVVDENCVNCHAVNQQNPANFMFHVRGSMGGTFFVLEGDLQKFNLKTKEMENGATYPRWHPSGKFVAFSSNKVVQQFHSSEQKKIEVSDLESSLLLYNVTENSIQPVTFKNSNLFMDTYPEWSPDGKYLYFCRAKQIDKNYLYSDIRYNLYRTAFNGETKSFSAEELVFNADTIGKSVSFPRISPDGKQLIFTLHNYGCFPIWHKEADLWSINLEDFSTKPVAVNSDFTESYHSWSANGRWLIFSSKRDDGLSARPYIAYIDESGNAHKPFILPQKDPLFYSRFLKTFNIPEFSESDFSFLPGEIRKAAQKEAKPAKWLNQ